MLRSPRRLPRPPANSLPEGSVMVPPVQRAREAFSKVLGLPDIISILDIGSGNGEHARGFRSAGKQVTTVSLKPPADLVMDFMEIEPQCSTMSIGFDCIWASHVLEHMPNVGLFLDQCFTLLRPNGVLAVTVPPLKHQIVGGHVSLWNAGLLLYRLILAGFDCKLAQVGTYPYDISVLVRKYPALLPSLEFDKGDIERLAEFFPFPVEQNFDGRVDCNWEYDL